MHCTPKTMIFIYLRYMIYTMAYRFRLGCSASRVSKIVKLPSLFGVFSIFRTQKHTRNNCRNEEISRRRYQKRICLYETDCQKLRYDKATTIHFDDFHDFLSILAQVSFRKCLQKRRNAWFLKICKTFFYYWGTMCNTTHTALNL